jgi:hypothetical protein
VKGHLWLEVSIMMVVETAGQDAQWLTVPG